ncbi:uncharacterized protein LOC116245998 [Nymphaea colorata]|uniref:uncharacterized protein LOC116245998 n=1 Tax=Nymphaea colorata TaxID=210225 RepID=UPI00214E054A|nr:uncharacterized protein LOC116245998 [Nymphaea colorata]
MDALESNPNLLEGGWSFSGVAPFHSSRSLDVESRHCCAVSPGEGVQIEARLSEKRGAMMIVSVLIATLSYQAALNPPGGSWPDNKSDSASTAALLAPFPPAVVVGDEHTAGTAINATRFPYAAFVVSNAVGLFASLATILLLTTARTIKRPIMMWGLIFIIWVSVFSVALSFVFGLMLIAHDMPLIVSQIFLSCMGLFAILLILPTAICVRKLIGWVRKQLSCRKTV